MSKVVVNSTPLIALSKCGKLDILQVLFKEINIPEAVYNEICAKDDIVSQTVKMNLTWIHVQKIVHTEDKKMYRSRLHDGEVEVMILAQEINADLVLIDDYAARSTAKYLDLPLGGTLGVLITAKRHGLINSVSDTITEMEGHNIYYSEKLKQLIKIKAGE